MIAAAAVLVACRDPALHDGTVATARAATTTKLKGPQVTIAVPADKAYFAPGSDIIVVARLDPGAKAKHVRFYSNNAQIPSASTDPLRTLFHPPSAGQFILTARVDLATGSTIASRPVRIVVEQPHADLQLTDTGLFLLSIGKEHVGVVITKPRPSVVTIGSNVTIIAEAASAKGSVRQVTYLVDGKPIATRSAQPYEVIWTPSTTGRHVITARVRDSLGYEAESNPVAVEVRR